MPQHKPVKILMGLHENAGWRSFKTSKEVHRTLIGKGLSQFVYADGLVLPDVRRKRYLTEFGDRLLEQLTQPYFQMLSPRFIRYRYQQFEIFVTSKWGWEEHLRLFLPAIAQSHSDSGTREYHLATCNISGREPAWDREFLLELEEIDQNLDPFFATR